MLLLDMPIQKHVYRNLVSVIRLDYFLLTGNRKEKGLFIAIHAFDLEVCQKTASQCPLYFLLYLCFDLILISKNIESNIEGQGAVTL